MNLLEVAKHALEAMEDAMYRADTHEFYDAKESLRYAIEQAEQAEQKPVALSDERIDFIADTVVKGMPEGISGFCKSWGWRQFARAILQDCAGHYAPTPQPEQPHDLLCLCGAEWDIYSDGREELVAAPTPRKPLTVFEIDAIAEHLDKTTIGWATHEFAAAIEKAHGIGEQHE